MKLGEDDKSTGCFREDAGGSIGFLTMTNLKTVPVSCFVNLAPQMFQRISVYYLTP